MIPPSFEYLAPRTLREAASLLSKYKDDAKVLAGGQSLIPLLKLRLASYKYLIDLGRISGLSYIREEQGQISIGAMTTHDELLSSNLLREKWPIFGDAENVVGDMQVRSLGTIGGSLSHADPAADLPAVALALDAEMKIYSDKGERQIKSQDFFKGPFATALEAGEIVTEIRIPLSERRTGSAYEKFPNKASGFAIVGAACTVTVDDKGLAERVRVAVTGATATPFRVEAVEHELQGMKLESGTISKAASLTIGKQETLSDIHASGEYRRWLAQVHVKRALQKALGRTSL